MPLILIIFSLIFLISSCSAIEIDSNGYVAYCPCMGRFGNQADHFLGSLAFAKALNRTLILPPWVEYKKGNLRSVQVPFDDYFEVEKLHDFHRIILMADFMEDIAPIIWPPERRVSFCYMERKSIHNPNSNKSDCFAKDGNPFGPFWDTHQIDFVDSEFYGPLHFDVLHNTNMISMWKTKYPADDWPVLAFTGAPASFPVQSENRELQKFLQWNKQLQKVAESFIQEKLPRGAFIGIHLRNGIDWVRACEHVRDNKQLFASPQCLGYKNEYGELTSELCMPSKDQIIKQLKRLIRNVKQTSPRNEIRSVFVASDANHLISELTSALTKMNITAFKLEVDDPRLDLIILGKSNHFIGNCISSFSAFVKRERDVRGFPSYFWSYPNEKNRPRNKVHEEL